MSAPKQMRWMVVGLIASLAAPAQQAPPEEERTRQLWDTNLLAKRPAGKKNPVKPVPASSKTDDAFVGITLWQLRPSKSADEPQVRSLIHEDTGPAREWTPERIGADTPLQEGQKVRISIETARTGYLYVIDREAYSDGGKGDPYLIFPTERIRGGSNRVTAGTVIEIPSSEDSPSYFKVERSRPGQVSELLTILVSPEPIPGLQIERGRKLLTEKQVADWEKRWKAAVHRLESKGETGKPLTVAEKQAASGASQLTSDDPVPQTMFRVDAKEGAPLMVEVPLRIAQQ